jgi:hypothetical protein
MKRLFGSGGSGAKAPSQEDSAYNFDEFAATAGAPL